MGDANDDVSSMSLHSSEQFHVTITGDSDAVEVTADYSPPIHMAISHDRTQLVVHIYNLPTSIVTRTINGL